MKLYTNFPLAHLRETLAEDPKTKLVEALVYDRTNLVLVKEGEYKIWIGKSNLYKDEDLKSKVSHEELCDLSVE